MPASEEASSGSSGASADAGAAASCEEDEDGSVAPAASAADADDSEEKGKVETLEEHIAKQDYKTLEENLAKKFLKRRCRFIDRLCSYTNPVTSKKETWLGCRNGHAICIVCNSYLGQRSKGAAAGSN